MKCKRALQRKLKKHNKKFTSSAENKYSSRQQNQEGKT